MKPKKRRKRTKKPVIPFEGKCRQPDRDEPALVCGYPLPCPHHTNRTTEFSVTPKAK